METDDPTSVEMGNLPSSDLAEISEEGWSERLMAFLSHENAMEDELVDETDRHMNADALDGCVIEEVSERGASKEPFSMTPADAEDMQWYRGAGSEPEDETQLQFEEAAERSLDADEALECLAEVFVDAEEEDEDEDYDPFNTVPVVT